jgi:hypothetical protein
MNRITLTLDENGYLVRICVDQEVEVYIVQSSTPRDRVYRWSSLAAGKAAVEEEIGGWRWGTRITFQPSTDKQQQETAVMAGHQAHRSGRLRLRW